MDAEICRNFLLVTTNFPDKLDNDGKYYFKDDQHFKQYCSNQNCVNELEKVNAGCLYLLYTFFGSSDLFKSVANSNINIVEYIIIWLSYMLNLKEQSGSMTNLEYFNKTYINSNEKYTNSITGVTEYSSYKDLIYKKHDLTKVDIKDISEFYDAFILLCEMYTGFDTNTSNCTTCSEKANKFVKKCKDLIENYNNNNNKKSSSYNKILSTLSTDYDNFKIYCNSKGADCEDYPLFPEIKTTQLPVQNSENNSEQFYGHISEDTSSSSPIANKLFIVLSAFGAIAFFLGISYKYSLFGFRKRSQKQHLRGKLKK
ncbi:BIR protein [Plasmodium berghei]|uniref:BIR protein n=2 Tax=Plasmodium berghei TaxID=5821 RepID=A0A509AI13_PLABA|nr:BIR protein [Plasmodium berghei ANKA]CXH19850.1 BIR protein [Plasmodium berghei]SBW38379.1 BIR protein [Plasmodium berghei]SCL84441.1 BIR protein [Plasmodium berghei]SCL86914.1 BIR protein [Plasmodium berghei]VUC55537.1 BIR protein [Plasmodium berghei ANKA]|eukprot:XP_034421348.1 BIR protein [Plasmodium berghei ANKA]